MPMTDAQIEQYLAEIRKWPKRPTDYGPKTEDIIRRYLRGEIASLCDPPVSSQEEEQKGIPGQPTPSE